MTFCAKYWVIGTSVVVFLKSYFFYEKFSIFLSNLPDKVFIIKIITNIFYLRQQNFQTLKISSHL